MRDLIKRRIQKRIDDLGTSYHRAALDAGLERSFIADLFKDKPKHSFGADHLPALALALDCDVAYMVGAQDEPRAAQGDLPIAGTVEGGVFRGSPAEGGRAPVAPDQRYAASSQVAFNVADDHAANIAVRKGDFITVLIPSEGEIAPSSLRPDDIVIAARDNGDISETTVRIVCIRRNEAVLLMPSDAPGSAAVPYDRILGRLISTKHIF